MQSNNDSNLINHGPVAGPVDATIHFAERVKEGKFFKDDLNWAVSQCTPHVSHQKLLLERIASESTRESTKIKKSVRNEDITTEVMDFRVRSREKTCCCKLCFSRVNAMRRITSKNT